MAILASQEDWGQRAARAFAEQWRAMGGQLVGHETIDQLSAIANQIAGLLRVQESERRNQRIQCVLGDGVTVQPTPRAKLEAIFLAANPLQARQIKPTLVFQYAGDLQIGRASCRERV